MLEVGSTTAGGNVQVNATLGSELAPALTGNSGTNWTLSNTTGYTQPFVGTIEKTGDGTGTITQTTGTVTIGTIYKLTVVVSSYSGGGFIYATFGGSGPIDDISISSAGTYTAFMKASSTAKLVFQVGNGNTSRFVISSISIVPITTNTGDVIVNGSIKINRDILNYNGVSILTTNGVGNVAINSEPEGSYRLKIGGSIGITSDIYWRGGYMLSTDIFMTPTNGVATIRNSNSGTSSALALYSKNTEAMRIDPLQRVGFGITTPSSKLDVNGTARVRDSLKALAKVYMTGIPTVDTAYQHLAINPATGEVKRSAVVQVGKTNKVTVDSANAVRMTGNATVWNDLVFSSTQLKTIGVAAKPDFSTTELGLLFPQNDTTENVGIIVQMPHFWKEGSSIYPHIHWIQSSADTATWKIKYRVYNIGATIPAWTIITNNNHSSPYTSGTIQQLATFPAISMSGKTLSCIIDIILYRNDNILAGDALLKQFDLHIEQDALGSNSEISKN
jgi:hypothetical protein